MGDIRVLRHKNGNSANGKFQPAIMQRSILSRPHRFAFIGQISQTLDKNIHQTLDRGMLDQLLHIEAKALNDIDAQPTDFDNLGSTRRRMLELLGGKHRQDYADFLTCIGVGYFNCGEYQNSINLFNTLMIGPDICDTAQVRLGLARACGTLAEQWLLGSEELTDKATSLLDTALGHISVAKQKKFIGLDQTEIFELEPGIIGIRRI